MPVLMLSAAHPPEDVRILRKQGAALASAGWRVRHLCPAPPGGARSAAEGVEIATYPRRPGWASRVLGIPALARRAWRERASVIHAHEPDSWVAGLIAARLGGARLVLDVHEHYPSRLDARLHPALRPLARAALRFFCCTVAACSDAVVVAKSGLDDDFGGAARCTAVRNYALPAAVAPRRHAAGPVTLVHLGALTRSRGAFSMLEVLRLCPPETRLAIIGRFTDGSGEAFSAEAARLGLDGRIEAPGWLAPEAALVRVAEGDIGLVLFQPGEENHRLALPHKLFDCMLAGLPVIVPAFAEEVASVVAEAGCGIATDTSDPQAVAAAVARLSDPALRAEMGARGRQAALTRFGWAGEAERLVALYRRLAPPHSTQLSSGPSWPMRLRITSARSRT